MKTKTVIRPLIMIALMLIMLISWTLIQSDMAYADTTYTIFVYSGKEGYFGTEDVTRIRFTGLKYGENFTVDLGEYGLVVKNADQYYARGVKDAGHDNDEIYQSYTFTVTEDMSFAVAYGMKGGMVEYTVNYVSEDGDVLHEPETFWGMPGDKPVVSYRMVDGYLPYWYNEEKRLTDDPADNVFTFTYYATGNEGGDNGGTTDDAGGNGGGGNNPAGTNPGGTTPAGGNAGADQGQAGEGTVNVPDAGETPLSGPGDIVDLDDGDTPTTDPVEPQPTPEAEGGSNILYYVLGGCIGVALIALIALLLTRKNKHNS